MNASNGSLVASVATDDDDFAARVAYQVQALKVGVSKPRSREDREEVSAVSAPRGWAPSWGDQVCRTIPPSTTSTWPVTQRPAGDTKRRKAPQSSEGSPRTFIAALDFIIW